jgi:hypothetical protein
MRQKTTMMMLALVLISSILMTTLMVQASGNKPTIIKNTDVEAISTNSKPLAAKPITTNEQVAPQTIKKQVATQVSRILKSMEDIQLDEVNDDIVAEINDLVKAYEALPDVEKKPHVPGVWVVWARGLSWESNTFPETSETAPESIPMGMRVYAKAICGNEEWTLYRLGRGIVGHDGERYRVDGYALYKKENGRFYLVLDGEGISLQAVGKVHGPNADFSAANSRRFLRLSMKGRMSIDGDNYVFGLRGFAFRLPILRAKPVKEAETPNTN